MVRSSISFKPTEVVKFDAMRVVRISTGFLVFHIMNTPTSIRVDFAG